MRISFYPTCHDLSDKKMAKPPKKRLGGFFIFRCVCQADFFPNQIIKFSFLNNHL